MEELGGKSSLAVPVRSGWARELPDRCFLLGLLEGAGRVIWLLPGGEGGEGEVAEEGLVPGRLLLPVQGKEQELGLVQGGLQDLQGVWLVQKGTRLDQKEPTQVHQEVQQARQVPQQARQEQQQAQSNQAPDATELSENVAPKNPAPTPNQEPKASAPNCQTAGPKPQEPKAAPQVSQQP